MRANCGVVRRARPLLGTLVDIRIDARGSDALNALERAFAAVERVHRAMSTQEATSDIARLRARRRTGLDPWTRRVLERAEEIRARTDGLFDCAACDYSLDGIAKGFAVDRAVECLEDAGIATGVVNAGGDLRIFGDAFELVYVRRPENPAELIVLGQLRSAAVATSASRGLIDPLPRQPRSPATSMTVIAADCTTADALTKPCLLDPARASELAGRFGARAIVLGTGQP